MKCKQLFETIENLNSHYLDILEDVCNIESPTDFKEGVDAVGTYFLKLAKEHDWETEVFEQAISGDVVCITLNPDAEGEPICISGHMDTVHPIGSFGYPAVKRDNVKMFGPGVMDCKGGIVAAFMAMDAVKKCGFKKRPIQLLLQSDEENSSITSDKATIKYICEKSKNAIAFLNLEGIQGNTAVVERKGILRYCFTVHGKALHSARCAEASNAIAEAAFKIVELEKMKNVNGLTCNCGIIQGGTTANTVADKCCFYADIRFFTKEELASAKQHILHVANNITVKGCSCDLKEVSFRPAMVRSEKNISLLERMNAIYKENGLPELTPRTCLSGSDAAYITEYGIPCVDNVGTDGGEIHSLNEYIIMDSLVESAKRIAAIIYCM